MPWTVSQQGRACRHAWRGAVVEENTLRVHIHAIRYALAARQPARNNLPVATSPLVGHGLALQQVRDLVTEVDLRRVA